MRTTVDLDEDVLAVARVLAAQKRVSLGAAVSEIARRGLSVPPRTYGSGFPVFPDPDTGHVITDDLVAQHRDDD